MKKYHISPDDIEEETLVGGIQLGPPTYPQQSGNCFSVTLGGRVVRIVNMNVENFREWFRINGDVVKSVQVFVDVLGNGIIADTLFGHKWYSEEYCSSCYRE